MTTVVHTLAGTDAKLTLPCKNGAFEDCGLQGAEPIAQRGVRMYASACLHALRRRRSYVRGGGRRGRERRQRFALGYLLGILLVAVIIILVAVLIARLI